MTSAGATIDALLADPARTALLADYDGSLAVIVEDPALAVPLPGVVDLLGALVPKVGRVGVVSGRPVEFLAQMLPVDGLALVGQYGLERLDGDAILVDPRAEPYLDAVAAAANEAEARWPDLLVERKGAIAVTVHWRGSPEDGAEIAPEAEALAARHGLAVYASRMAREIRPPVPVDKGEAVSALVEGCEVAAFAGDDRGDLAAFDALSAAVAAGRLRHAVRIGVDSSEAPPELADHTDVMVAGPEGLVALLSELADRL